METTSSRERASKIRSLAAAVAIASGATLGGSFQEAHAFKPEHGVYKTLFSAVTKNGKKIRVDECTQYPEAKNQDDSMTLYARCLVVVINGADAETIKADRYRDGGTTTISFKTSDGVTHSLFIPSLARQLGKPKFDGEEFTSTSRDSLENPNTEPIKR